MLRGFGISSHRMGLGSDLQFSQPDAQPLNCIVAGSAFQFDKRFLGCLGGAFQFGKFLPAVAVFSSFLSSGSPRYSPLLSRLVDCNGMCCVVFALWSVGSDLLRIL